MRDNRRERSGRQLGRSFTLFLFVALFAVPTFAATYYVDRGAANASDENPGTEARPWTTVSRAAAAKELAPGDTVLIRSGVYREHVKIEVSGEKGKPVTFAAAPGARVVIKGSEIVRGRWTKLTGDAGLKEPYPNAFSGVWRIPLGEVYFTDPRFAGSFRDKSKRWVSQVFADDDRPFQRIGPSRIYRNEPYLKLATVGRDLSDIVQNSFFFDAAGQTLYVKMSGEPAWYSIEVGVRGFTLTARNVHDVVIRGIEMRHNRQPGGQWPMVSVGECERVALVDCRIHWADFAGLGLYKCRRCIVRNCDLSHNGCNGLAMSHCEECVIESCTLLFNNYRRFHAGWAAGGMKCIPGNRRCIVRNCEAAYNTAAHGIWFDADNSEIRIVGNVSHHNGGCGIFFEINKDGGVIADNLVYANRGRGIYVSGSRNTWVVHNTVAANGSGIVCMPRGKDWPLENVRVLNNLLIRNYVTAENVTRGSDLTLFMGTPGDGSYRRTVTSNHSDHNVYAATSWTPTMRHHWNPDNTLREWQERFGEDAHSKLLPVEFELRGTGFRLLTTAGLDAAGPLPEELDWRPVAPLLSLERLLGSASPRRVGCRRTRSP